LGDRHPDNLMLERDSGKIIHIDFGDCFEVTRTREKYPEKFPFRLTRMLTNAMEVCGIEGNFTYTCINVMKVLRDNKESLMAVLEAFVYDPLINWRLLTSKAPSLTVTENESEKIESLENLTENEEGIDENSTENTENREIMFTFKLMKNSLNSARLSIRHISNGTRPLLGLFKNEEPPQEPFELKDEDEVDPSLRSQEIMRIRNKSGLLRAHRLMLHGEVPYRVSESWIHETVKYKRKIYAKYGSKSGIDPRICFPTETELHEKNEYERVAYPKTVKEMIAIIEKQKQEKRERTAERQATIAINLQKLSTWKKDIKMRRAKKETDARAAKERKDRLIEEVRRIVGYKMDSRDEKFKELLVQKEKAQKKALKETKRLEKEKKLFAKLNEDKNATSENKEAQPEDDDVDGEEPDKKQ